MVNYIFRKPEEIEYPCKLRDNGEVGKVQKVLESD